MFAANHGQNRSRGPTLAFGFGDHVDAVHFDLERPRPRGALTLSQSAPPYWPMSSLRCAPSTRVRPPVIECQTMKSFRQWCLFGHLNLLK